MQLIKRIVILSLWHEWGKNKQTENCKLTIEYESPKFFEVDYFRIKNTLELLNSEMTTDVNKISYWKQFNTTDSIKL